MPYTEYSPFGTTRGNVTDAERMAQQQRQADMQAQAAMAEIAARERMQGKSDATARYGVDAGLKQFGTHDQRALQESGMFAKKAAQEVIMADKDGANQVSLANVNNKHLNSSADLDKKKYEDGAVVQNAMNTEVLRLLSGQGGAGGMSEGDIDRFSAIAAIRGNGSMPNPHARAVDKMTMEDLQRNRAKGRAQELLASGDAAGARASAQAAGVPLEIQPIEEYMTGDGAGFASELSEKTKGFAARDTSMMGWDPEQGDVDGIMGELTRLVGVLEKRGYPREDAVREASRIIKNSMGEDKNDVNAGWIGNLRGRVDGFR